MGTGELIFLVALMTATGALAIDQMLPAFPEMRAQFGLAEDSTRLSLAVTLFFVGCGVGNLFAGPLAGARWDANQSWSEACFCMVLLLW